MQEREFAKFPLQPLLHNSLTTKQPKNDTNKQHSKVAKTGEVEGNYERLLNQFS